MSTSAYNDRDRPRSSTGDRNRDQGRAYNGESDRSNKRRHEDQGNDWHNKRPKQDHSDTRNRQPQQSQDGQFRNRSKKHELGQSGGPEHTKNQTKVIVEDNRRLKAELKALKASIAQGNTHIQNGNTTSAQLSHSEALAQLPAPEETVTDIALYTPFTVPGGLPQLPPVDDDKLRSAVFKHKSICSNYRDGAGADVTYEKLEYLGDAYLELIASRMIYHRFPTLSAGKMSQGRETLVKNETLAVFSKAYGFDTRLHVDKSVKTQMLQDKANKGFNKVLGDVFEAYVAAVCMSHEDGFAAAEKWLTALWAPKMLELYHADKTLVVHGDDANPLEIFNPNATQELSNRVGTGRDCKLEYISRGTIELKGDHLGQNLWIMDLYFTGYGYTSKLLATGKGANQKEAKAWAAIKAMHGKTKTIIEECEVKCQEAKAQRKAQKEKEKESQNEDKQKSDSMDAASTELPQPEAE